MAFQYCYTIYDFHYPADQQARIDQMTADGWQMFTAAPGSLELSVVWQRELPSTAHRAPQKHRENLAADDKQVSGGLKAHEGQGAR